MTKRQAIKPQYSKVSEWIEEGGLRTGWYHLMNPVVEDREKSIAVSGKKWNATATRQYDFIVWFPKSLIIPVEDDYYTDKFAGQNYLVPEWLLIKKREEGIEL